MLRRVVLDRFPHILARDEIERVDPWLSQLMVLGLPTSGV